MPPRTVTHISLHNDSYLLRYDVANGTDSINDWSGYDDFRLKPAHKNRSSNLGPRTEPQESQDLRKLSRFELLRRGSL